LQQKRTEISMTSNRCTGCPQACKYVRAEVSAYVPIEVQYYSRLQNSLSTSRLSRNFLIIRKSVESRSSSLASSTSLKSLSERSQPSGCSAEYLGPNIQSVKHRANVLSIYRPEHHGVPFPSHYSRLERRTVRSTSRISSESAFCRWTCDQYGMCR
jgi:hypothetical protein